MRYFFIVLIWKCARRARFTSFAEFQLLHTVIFINVSSKTVDQSEDPRGGASIASTFVFRSKLARQLFYLTASEDGANTNRSLSCRSLRNTV